MKKALVIRCGALGDMIIISPVFRILKDLGYRTYCYTGKRGLNVLKYNPYIDEFIEYEKEGQENPDIQKDWDDVKNRIKPDWFKNFSESIEVNLALHPLSPAYYYPKNERRERCDKNYYDETLRWAGFGELNNLTPELFISDDEEKQALSRLRKGKINIVWGMSGSAGNKAYPWTDYVMGEVIKEFKDVHFMTVGDNRCKILEYVEDPEIIKHVTNLSGEISFRETIALTKVVDLVISPDTGTLHASGAWDTYKIGILGHTTIENITKYFKNDYSLEADPQKSECSPCFRLIYDHTYQCPIDIASKAAWCMHYGQPADRLFEQVKKVIERIYDDSRNRKTRTHSQGVSEKVSCLS